MLESGLLQQLRGWVHQTGLQMDQLTTIFAAPASDENGVNCGARTKNGQLSLVNVLHIHFTQTTSTSLDTSGSLTSNQPDTCRYGVMCTSVDS